MTNSTLISNGREELFAIREEYSQGIADNGEKKIFGIGNSIAAGNCVEESLRMLQAVGANGGDVISIPEFLRRIERSTAALLLLSRYADEVCKAIEHSLKHGETEYKAIECPVCGDDFIIDNEYWENYVWGYGEYEPCCSDECEHKRSHEDLEEQKSDIEDEFRKAIENHFDCEFEDWNEEGSVWELINDTHAHDNHEYIEGWHSFDYEGAVSSLEEDDLENYCSFDSHEDIEERENSDSEVYRSVIADNDPTKFELQTRDGKESCVGARITDNAGRELFIHRAESGLGWKVTHGPSGLGFGKTFFMMTHLAEDNEKSEYHRSVAIVAAYQVAQQFCSVMLDMLSEKDLFSWDDWGRNCGKTIKQVRDNAIEIAEATARMR